MNVWTLYAWGWAAVAFVFFLFWLIEERTKNAGFVDTAWALCTGLLPAGFALFLDGPPARRALVAILAGVWGLRLSLYLLARNFRRPEDRRYAALRADWRSSASWKFFVFFQLQALTVLLLSLTPFAAMRTGYAGFRIVDAIGVLVWIAAVAGESIADRQLSRFRARGDGGICRDGLWRVSRHPNYFFEWLHWLAYPFLAAGSPVFALSLIAPVAMYLVLVKGTGIVATERVSVTRHGDAYRAYQRTTSAFFPWFPRKEKT